MKEQLTISWAPLVPWELLAGVAGLAALLLLFALIRRAPGAWWRTLAIATLLIALANPSLVEELRDGLSDVALVVVDDSPSQSIEPRQDQSAAALAQLTEALAGLENTEVEVVRGGAATYGRPTR